LKQITPGAMISPAVIAISLCGGSLGKKQTSPDQNHIKNQHQQQPKIATKREDEIIDNKVYTMLYRCQLQTN